jgi:hypothetical protein
MSDAENWRTSIQGGSNFAGAGSDAMFKKLFQASAEVEMSLSKIGNEMRHTRQGYKDGHKRKAFDLMLKFAANFNIHSLVIERAKQE